ncbi:MAG: DUF1549 domain-containing protein [Isosphaeraceae bacterium]|nr:DUF1549 domain-containing protein [Isosphaeraceae bacterium]
MSRLRQQVAWTAVVSLSLAALASWPARGASPAKVITKAKPAEKAKAKAMPAPPEPAKIPPPPSAPAGRVVTPPTLTPEEIDTLLERILTREKAEIAPLTTDVEFVRRVFLDVTGTLPSPKEVVGFVRSRDRDKRVKLIDYLLDSSNYARNWAHYWRDVIEFRATSENPGNLDDLENWFATRFEQNVGWDLMARELITATRNDRSSAASAFARVHDNQPVELAGEVSRVFLGVQIQCAQCHDHPSDSWTRLQFHEFAAFFAERGRYMMPDKADPARSISIAPKFFLGEKAEPLPMDVPPTFRRARGADFVTSVDNPWFARAFVNRLWFALMGEGFYAPVDDMGPGRTAKAPQVLEPLAAQWAKGGYDIKWLFRTLLNTRAYQREVRSTYSASGRTTFAANTSSRLRADQITVALNQTLGLQTKPERSTGAFGPLTKLFAVDPSTPPDDVLGTIPQALFMMNSPQIHSAISGENSRGLLGRILESASDNRAALDALYLTVLSRTPTRAEVQACARYLEHSSNRQEAFEDILWALINSTEFVSRR